MKEKAASGNAYITRFSVIMQDFNIFYSEKVGNSSLDVNRPYSSENVYFASGLTDRILEPSIQVFIIPNSSTV